MINHFSLVEEVAGCDGHQHDARHALFQEHISRTIAVAKSLHGKLPDGIIYEDQDFIMIGLHALWDCTENYDPLLNTYFWGYAHTRITGSMIDVIRRSDPVSRSYRDTLKRIEHQRLELRQTFQREATFEEACRTLGIDHEKSEKLSGISDMHFLSLDSPVTSKLTVESEITLAEIIADPNGIDPTTVMDRDGDIFELEKLLEKLEPIERSVIRLYFFSGLRLHDISSSIGLTESRVSQMLDNTLRILKRLALKNGDAFSRYNGK